MNNKYLSANSERQYDVGGYLLLVLLVVSFIQIGACFQAAIPLTQNESSGPASVLLPQLSTNSPVAGSGGVAAPAHPAGVASPHARS